MRQGPGVSKEKLGESSGDASIVAEAPGLKESWGEVDIWHCGEGPESLKRTQRLEMKTQSRFSRDPKSLGMVAP